MCFISIGSLIMYLLIKYDPFVETVGFLAVFTEAMLGTPQFYRNYTNKSTFGMRYAYSLYTWKSPLDFQFFSSLQMVLMWTCGDVFKTTYFHVRKTPPQFVICGLLQVLVDVAILTQVWLYYENTAKRKKASNMHFWQDLDMENMTLIMEEEAYDYSSSSSNSSIVDET